LEKSRMEFQIRVQKIRIASPRILTAREVAGGGAAHAQ